MAGRAHAELEHPPARLAELHLGDRREHPGRDMRRGATKLIALQQHDRHALPAGTPGHRQADDAAA